MPMTLDIKLPNGKQAPVHAYSLSTLAMAMEIVDREQGKKGAWGSLVKPHKTKNAYEWDVIFTDSEPVRVSLPKGSTINMYR